MHCVQKTKKVSAKKKAPKLITTKQNYLMWSLWRWVGLGPRLAPYTDSDPNLTFSALVGLKSTLIFSGLGNGIENAISHCSHCCLICLIIVFVKQQNQVCITTRSAQRDITWH